jgi:transcriptional regulator with XRE-family HTH domain
MAIKRIAGTNIRNYRKQLGWTMEKLAVRCKLNYDFVGNVERGERSISIENLEKIAKALKVETWKLLFPEAFEVYPNKASKGK